MIPRLVPKAAAAMAFLVRPLSLLGALVLGLGMAGCAPRGDDAAEGLPSSLRLADTGIDGLEELTRAFGPFAAELERLTGLPVTFFPVSDRTAAVTALQFNQVDLVLAGPSEYIIMRQRLAVQPVVGIERPRYFTAFIVKADSPAQTLADLRGRRIALKDPGSTTGHIIPVVMLRRAGLDPDRDVSLRMLDGARIEALVNGDVDALGSGVRDYDQLIARFGEGSYRILAESPPMPPDLILARRGLPADFVASLSATLLGDGVGLMELLMAGTHRERHRTGARFIPVTDADFDLVREGYALLGLSPE